jgi:hypothetical protein
VTVTFVHAQVDAGEVTRAFCRQCCGRMLAVNEVGTTSRGFGKLLHIDCEDVSMCSQAAAPHELSASLNRATPAGAPLQCCFAALQRMSVFVFLLLASVANVLEQLSDGSWHHRCPEATYAGLTACSMIKHDSCLTVNLSGCSVLQWLYFSGCTSVAVLQWLSCPVC